MNLTNYYVYGKINEIAKFENYNLIKLEKKNINELFLKNISLLIITEHNDELFKITKKLKIIIFTNILKYEDNVECIYYKKSEELKRYIDIINNNLSKTFTILIPIYNSYNYLAKCISSVFNQTFSNYNIYLCDDNSNYDEFKKCKNTYHHYKNIKIFRNSKNIGKFLTLNLIFDKIKSDYFLVLDSDDRLTKNRLILDLINLNNNDVYGVQSKYIRFDVEKKNIVEYNYGHNSITYKKDIIKKVGYYCPNRFGSDTEYIMRIKKLFGDNSIFKYNNITYIAHTRTDKTNLTHIYDKEKRKIFIKKILNIYKNLNNDLVFFNFKSDYFVDLIKYNNINTLDISVYKKFYMDICNLSDNELVKHWETIGKNEGRLPNLNKFNYTFPNFNHKLYLSKSNKKYLTDKYKVFGFIYLKNKNNYIDWLKKNNYYTNNNDVVIKNINADKITDFNIFIKKNNIKYINVSKALEHFESRICEKFNLVKYNKLCDKFENVIFFGLYDNIDYIKITNHIGNKYLMWGGTDSNINYDFRKDWVEKISNYLDIKNLAISDDIYKSLSEYGIMVERIYLNMVDTNIFKPSDNIGSSIYIYNGFTKGNEKIYGKSIYEEVMKKLPEYKYILSNELELEYSSMAKVYEECFIGLRLTAHDGNANTVLEFNAMGIPIIFNGEGGISWNNADDIIKKIQLFSNEKKIYNNKLMVIDKNMDLEEDNNDVIKNIILENNESNNNDDKNSNSNLNLLNLIDKYDEVYEYDFFNNDFSNDDLDNIYKNIDNFMKLFENEKNILFICGDYPGYGGAATNCNKIQEYFIKNNFNTYAIYYNYQGETNIKLEKTDKYEIIQQMNLNQKLSNLDFKPDVIILKSACHVNLKKIFNCPIIFLIPGIFKNDLDKYYNELNNDEYEKFINKNVINQIKQSDLSFCNSSHTKQILLEKFSLKIYLFYSGFVPFYGLKINYDDNWINRKYQYGLIVSDFDRKIKNVEKSINFLRDKENVVLIGKNSHKYKNHGFECVDLVDNNKMHEYYKNIKYVIQDSFYESCSNVKIECLINGCKIHKKKKILLSSTQYPGYGGAATNIYKIIEILRKEYYDVYGVFFHNDLSINYNPNNFPNIYIFDSKYFKNNSYNLIHNDIIKFYKNIGEPDIILAKNYDAPKFLKMIFPFSKIYYLLSGLNHFPKFYNNLSAYEFEKLENIEEKIYDEEYVLNICDGIIINSSLTQKLFNKIYNFDNTKQLLIDTTLITYYNFNNKNLKIESKIFDIVISCSRLDRIDKNNLWLIELLKNPYFNCKKILIVGNNNEKFKNSNLNLDIVYYNLITNEEMINLFKMSKILLFPSLYDSNSNTVIEAFINKCFPITTKNVGNHYYLNNNFLCDEKTYDIEEWKNKIKNILDNYNDYFYNFKFSFLNDLININYINLIDLINNTEKNKIIITSSQYPGYGGAATNCYNIHNYLLKNNYSSLCVFLENHDDKQKPLFNPLNLPNTYLFKRDNINIELINKFNPNIIFCKNYYCPYYYHKTFGNKYKIYYLVSGSIHATYMAEFDNSCNEILKMSVNELNVFLEKIGYDSKFKNSINMEKYSIEYSDFILPNSQLSYNLLNKIYKNYKNKILMISDTSIYSEITTFNKLLQKKIIISERKYDVCFISSILDRKIKNFDFVYKLFSNDKMIKYNKIVIGNNDKNTYDLDNKNIIHINHLNNYEILNILINAKILLIPSLFDASPNIANEANECGCYIITSNNIGNLKKNYVVINNYDILNWIKYIEELLKKN